MELIFADLESVEKGFLSMSRLPEVEIRKEKYHLQMAGTPKEHLENGLLIALEIWDEDQLNSIKDAQLITSKPIHTFVMLMKMDFKRKMLLQSKSVNMQQKMTLELLSFVPKQKLTFQNLIHEKNGKNFYKI